VFGAEARITPGAPPPVDVKTLHAKIGELTLANDFLNRDKFETDSFGRRLG
jgi:transposase